MRHLLSYTACNPMHVPVRSETLDSEEKAVAWAAVAAQATGYHSEVVCTCTSIPDAEYGDEVLDVQSNRIGVVFPGETKMVRRTDVGYPSW